MALEFKRPLDNLGASKRGLNTMKQLYQFKTYPHDQEWIVIVKSAAWLIVLFYGHPSIQAAIVGLIGRLG
jgi:hypothetical protein